MANVATTAHRGRAVCVGSLGCLLGCLLRRQWGKFLENQTGDSAYVCFLCVLCETHLGTVLGLMRLEFLSFKNMRFRLLRRRLTINSPRMAVRSALPWPFRWAMAALVFGFCAAIALWAFEFGKVIIILTNLVCNARENGPIRYRLLRPGAHPGLAARYRMVLVFRTFRFDAFCRPRS